VVTTFKIQFISHKVYYTTRISATRVAIAQW